MTKQEWLAKAAEHKQKLLSLVETYHPAARAARREESRQKLSHALPITAPGAEVACENIRQVIAARERNQAAPGERFSQALKAGNWQEIDSLLNSAWFGVPESTACWQIEGFKEAVDLIEDPPDDGDQDNVGADFRDDEDERDRGYDDDPAAF